MAEEAATHGGETAGTHWPAAWPLLLFPAFVAAGLFVFRGALQGAFVSDDFGYIVHNPYAALSMENIAAFFDPRSPAQVYAVGNYSPVHLLLHAAERDAFAESVLGYHVVNVLVHALNSVLLVALLRSSQVPALAALLGGAFFALHPANVESVAWISQLKTSASLAFALGALLALRRHPLPATLLFALALLTKASGAFALPTAAAFTWVRGRRSGSGGGQWAWLAVWTLLFAAYALVEFGAFSRSGWVEVDAFDDAWVQLRSVAAGGARYLVMAATSHGVSAFHEPEPVRSWLDPYWLAAVPLGLLLAWRMLATLLRRQEEGAWWVAAAASFAPISQVFPFVIPFADHYLYPILPGLIGGTLLFALSLRDRLPFHSWRVATAGLVALLVFFAWHSSARARLWKSETLLLLDAARHYPQGGTASLLRARSAAGSGDVETAVAELRRAGDRGLARFMLLEQDLGLARVRNAPEFRELVREWAGLWIERAERRGTPSQADLRMLGLAHLKRDEWAEAEAAYQRGIQLGGPLDPLLQQELALLRARRPGEERHRPEIP